MRHLATLLLLVVCLGSWTQPIIAQGPADTQHPGHDPGDTFQSLHPDTPSGPILHKRWQMPGMGMDEIPKTAASNPDDPIRGQSELEEILYELLDDGGPMGPEGAEGGVATKVFPGQALVFPDNRTMIVLAPPPQGGYPAGFNHTKAINEAWDKAVYPNGPDTEPDTAALEARLPVELPYGSVIELPTGQQYMITNPAELKQPFEWSEEERAAMEAAKANGEMDDGKNINIAGDGY